MFNVINRFKNTTRKIKYLVTFILILILWFFSGLFFAKEELPTNENKERAIPIISTQELSAQSKLVTLQLNGVVTTKNNIILMPEITGEIIQVNVEKGAFVHKDDVLFLIEVNDKQSNVKKAQTLLEQRKLEYESTKSLNEAGYSSEAELASSLANLGSAESDLNRANIDLENCSIKAPFTGIIDNIEVKQGMVISNSTALGRLIECKDYRIKTNIPERSIDKLKIKEADINLAGFFDHSIKGYVTGISMKSDDSTRSYEVEINIPELDGQCLNIVGMTADIDLHLYKEESYQIPPYSLSLSDEGLIGIKTLSPDNIVQFHKVEILEEDEEGYFWVKLPPIVEDGITLITQGHTYAKTGAQVEIN